jgi:integrase
MKSSTWTKVKREHGLYRYNPSGQYFARVRFRGKLHRRKLETADLELAKRKLRDFKNGLARTDASKGNASFAAVLNMYADGLTGSPKTIEDKRCIINKLKETWFAIDSLPLRAVKRSQVTAWLSKHYGHLSAAAYNAALSVIRGVFDLAVNDKIIIESPADGLIYRKRKRPIRPTPTFEEFKQIVADVRTQRFNREAEHSGDFIEFLGLAGLGQAEAASITCGHVDMDARRITVYRHKTDTGFTIPIYPQLEPLVEKLCTGKKSHERLFPINQARKAIANACKRLGFVRQLGDGRLVPQFTQRSLRRMFVTRAIEKGVDVKVIAEWQGHQDGGKLILQTYSHVRPEHSNRMALLMSDEHAANVIPMAAAGR